MIYTLGNKKQYGALLAERSVKKVVEGSVWKNYYEAEQYRISKNLNDFNFYGVLADWKHNIILSLESD